MAVEVVEEALEDAEAAVDEEDSAVAVDVEAVVDEDVEHPEAVVASGIPSEVEMDPQTRRSPLINLLN